MPESNRRTTSPGRIFPAGRVSFTDREKEVLDHLAKGFLYKEIAEALGLSLTTVERHWTFAKSWLRAELADADSKSPRENS